MKTVHDLLEDAKRRTVLLCIWVLGLSYIMSLTSHSIWVNIPVALLIIAMIRSLSGEIQIRWRTGQSSSPPTAARASTRAPRFRPHSGKDRFASSHTIFEIWRLGIEAPEVEAALEEITKSVVNEWVTNLWFRSLSPNQEFPEELANLINSVFAELSRRVKKINLITLLTQDIVDLLSSQLELFRRTQARVGADILGILSAEERDDKMKQAMAAAGELHPALVSTDSEYRVLQKLMGGLVSVVLRPDEGNCRVARILSRELLACAVMRPVMNLLNPGFVNTLIENAVARNTPPPQPEGSNAAQGKRTPDRPSASRDSSERGVHGLEMVPHSQTKTGQEDHSARGGLKSSTSEMSLMKVGASGDGSGKLGGKGGEAGSALLPVEGGQQTDAASWDRVPRKLEGRGNSGSYGHPGSRDSKENWAQLLEVVNQRKTMNLAPEHLDNLWAKGRNYKKKEHSKSNSKPADNLPLVKEPSISHPLALDSAAPPPKTKPDVNPKKHAELVELRSVSRESSAESNVLQSEAGLAQEEWNAGKMLAKEKKEKENEKDQESSAPRPIRKSRSIGAELDGWQALAHPGEGIPSLLQAGDGVGLGPGFDLDLALRKQQKGKQSQLPGIDSVSISTMLSCNQLQVDVVGAHFEKSGGSKTFAVYSIFVTDLQNRTWEVQRRFRNFEQLHRSLKDKPYYNLCLPAKRFLSSNLDNSFIRQRCALLDKYLKDLLAIPSIAELHEVWDFLSANSQTYAFGESPSMFKTLTSNVDDAVDDMFRQFRGATEVKPAAVVPTRDVKKPLLTGNSISPTVSHLPILTNPSISSRPGSDRRLPSQNIWEEEGESSAHDGLQQSLALGWLPEYEENPAALSTSPFGSEPGLLDAQRDASNFEGKHERALSEGNSPVGSLTGSDMADDDNLAIPPDWGPPKVSVPLLNLVDVIFELQGRGWIRRQVFWMAKQVLQLGMGDAIDDFLLAKIQELRREEVLAGGIRWLHRILWPDGIFLTKHPSRQANNSPPGSFEQRLEAARRAGVVREIILDRAPAGLVSLIGRKQYQRCAKDLFFFLQSAVCLKQLTYSLLELLLLATFPELQDTVLEVRNM
ncbi:unnamed protein product [Calypogeia fissa]